MIFSPGLKNVIISHPSEREGCYDLHSGLSRACVFDSTLTLIRQYTHNESDLTTLKIR